MSLYLVPSLRRAEAEARRMAAAGETDLSDAYLETVRGLKRAGAAVVVVGRSRWRAS